MIAKAEGKFLRISPTKVRQVIDLIRGRSAKEAVSILLHINKRPKEYLIKILKSSIANARVKGFGVEQLYVSRVVCNPGPSWKRFKAAAFGRAQPILKRTAHIVIELDVVDQEKK
ncbi:MAG: 50S ribosomal protein L22 [Candidatus Omnitrophica bacterium]|nr:50S ribosomal protein L22 [Candidatus Omnitrophota bacterium]